MTEETIKMILDFRDHRNRKQFLDPKDLALSISLEATELLEVFQWSGSNLDRTSKRSQIAEELADVLNYCVLMADRYGLDLGEIVQEKVQINEERCPVNKAYGKSGKYTEYQKGNEKC